MTKTVRKKSRHTAMNSSEYHDMYVSEETMWWYVGLRDVVLQYLRILQKPNAKILDAGCGTGKTMETLLEHHYIVSGIDIAEESLSFCQKRGLKNIQQISVTKLPFRNDSFNAILCMDVLGSLSKSEVSQTISEFYRVLQPDGYLFIECAAFEWLHSQHDIVTNVNKRYTRHELEMLFHTTSWKIVKSSYRVFLLFPLIVIVKLAKNVIRTNSHASTDQYTPPLFINHLITKVQLLENILFRRTSLPFGSSVFLIVKKR